MFRVTLFTLISLFFYLFDIGNLDGVRQGTEALYIQIAKEMAEANSVLVPLYRGEPHWSKPPLQFWFGMVFIKAFGEFSLAVTRSSMVFLSFVSSLYLAKILKSIYRIKTIDTLVLLLGCFGTLKFSRTFMMEVPLMFLPLISMYKYFQYSQSAKRVDLFISFFLGALAVLVKGPISIVMAVLSLGTYLIFEYIKDKKIYFRFKTNLIFFTGIFLTSSVWFLLCYNEYGSEFFRYFFIRENVGKFHQVDMPMRRIVEGIIMFCFPWLILIPSFFRGLLKAKKLTKFQLFSLACFLGHFLIWFVPKQRSHHYAIPSLGFFIIFSYSLLPKKLKKLDLGVGSLSSILVFIVASICLYFSTTVGQFFWGISSLSFSGLAICFLFKEGLRRSLVLLAISFFILWSTCIPVFFIPLVPADVIGYINKDPSKTVVVNDRRSFFFEQFLDRRVKVITAGEIEKNLKEGNSVITSHSRLFGKVIDDKFVTFRWLKWIRKPDRMVVLKAFKNRNLDILKENVYLLEKDEKN